MSYDMYKPNGQVVRTCMRPSGEFIHMGDLKEWMYKQARCTSDEKTKQHIYKMIDKLDGIY